jgi:hypothetical protein
LRIGISSNWANGARSFSFVGVSAHGAVGTLRGKYKAGLNRKSAGWTTFALQVSGKAKFVGVGARRAGFASCLRILIGVGTDRTLFTGTVVFESTHCAAAGGSGNVAVHAGGGGCVANTGATDAGGGVWGGVVGVVAGSNPGGIGRGLAFVFGEVTDEAAGSGAPCCATKAGSGVGGGAVDDSADRGGEANAIVGVPEAWV